MFNTYAISWTFWYCNIYESCCSFDYIIFVVFPILETKFVSYLKYLRYTITEFLFDRANYLIDGIGYQFKTFSEYKNAYRKMEKKEKKRRTKAFCRTTKGMGRNV